VWSLFGFQIVCLLSQVHIGTLFDDSINKIRISKGRFLSLDHRLLALMYCTSSAGSLSVVIQMWTGTPSGLIN
jgi:hypothetical protein